MSAEKDQGYYEPALPDPSNVPSLYAEMIRSRDYGDIRFYPDYKALYELGQYWTTQLTDERRSERAKKDIDTLIGRLAFELVARQNELCQKELGDVA